MNDLGIRKRHLGQTRAIGEIAYKGDTLQAMNFALQKQLRDHVEDCTKPEFFRQNVQKIQDAADDIDDREPEEVIEGLGKKLTLAESEVKKAKRSLFEKGDYSRWGYVNAVTHVATVSEDYGRASELQEMGGKVLEMTKRDWSALAKAA